MATLKKRHCFNCGDSLGYRTDAYSYRFESCGKFECQRAERDAQEQEREEAHEQLDRDMGYY